MKTTLKELKDKYRTPRNKELKANWISHNVYSNLAMPIAWLLLKTPITANQITGFTILLGFVGCCFFTVGNYYLTIVAIIFFYIHTVFDYVDGTVARAKNISSPLGVYLEFVGHDFIFTFLFFSIGMGCSFRWNHPFYFVLGGLSAVGYLLTKYTRRLKILSLLIFKKGIPVREKEDNDNIIYNDKKPFKNFLDIFKKIYHHSQFLWQPPAFTLFVLLTALLDLTYLFPLFYGITFPLVFIISFIYQGWIGFNWVYDYFLEFNNSEKDQ